MNLVRRLEDERLRARKILEELLDNSLDRHEDEPVPREWRNVGFVQELSNASAAQLTKDPRRATALAHLAVSACMNIPQDAYPAPVLSEAEATAWRRLAQAAQYRSDYDNALKALDAADRCLAPHASLGFDRALTGFVRALVFSDLQRFNESETLARESKRVFGEYGDRTCRATASCCGE
jgi:tetratricopeptide (TPR) repeat protein